MQKFIFILILICLIGCENNKKRKSRFSKEQVKSLHLESTKILNAEVDSLIRIDLNPFLKKQTFDFGSLVKEIKLIALETTNKSLLDNIRKLVVTESNIYIHDDYKDGSVVVFNSEGKFIKRLPSGKGPGELNRMFSISFDYENNELVVYQHSFLLFFTSTGEFIRQKRLPFGFRNFEISSDGYVFKTFDKDGNKHLGDLENFTHLVTDKNFKIKSAGLPYSKTNINLTIPNSLFKNNDELLITQRFTDTIYQYLNESDQLKAKYVLNYSSKKLPVQYLKGSWDKFQNKVRKNDYYFYLGQYLDTDSHHVFLLENWNKGLQTIIYRDKKSGNLKGGTTANFDVNQMPSLAFSKSVSRDYFISYHYPNKKEVFSTNSSIISDNDKLKTKNLTEDDNPVLVLFKLNDF
jgi:hypothetical protein